MMTTHLLETLLEATVAGQVKLGAPDRLKLRDEIYRRLVKDYEREARLLHKDLGGTGKFKLDAAWKQRELMKRARVMADAVTKTTRARLEEINKLPPGERAKQKKQWLTYKANQLDELVAGEAKFTAQTDLLAHSGVVNPDKSRVMYWSTVGTSPPRSPCPICSGLASGNPYTIRQATTLGAKAHPNCRDQWAAKWAPGKATAANVRRQVADGEITLWDGKAKTPLKGKASTTQKKLQPAAGGWKAKATVQKRTITRNSRRSA